MPKPAEDSRTELTLLQGGGEKLPDHDDLVQIIVVGLRDGTGSYYWKPIDDPDNQKAWRKAARAAGKLLGQRVQTHVAHSMVSVWVVEEDRTPEQVAFMKAEEADAIRALGRRLRPGPVAPAPLPEGDQ